MRFALLLAASAIACTPSVITPPAPDATDAADYDVTITETGIDIAAQVCAHLAAIGCPQPPTCADTIRHVQTIGLTDLHVTCLLGAHSGAEATACGSVRCP